MANSEGDLGPSSDGSASSCAGIGARGAEFLEFDDVIEASRARASEVRPRDERSIRASVPSIERRMSSGDASRESSATRIAFSARRRTSVLRAARRHTRSGEFHESGPTAWLSSFNQEAASAAFKRELKTQDAHLDAGIGCTALVHFAEQVYEELRGLDDEPLDAKRSAALFDGYRDLRAALADDLAMLRRLAGEMLSLNAELHRIGELHSYALQVIAERDREIEESKPLVIKLARPLRRLIPRRSEKGQS